MVPESFYNFFLDKMVPVFLGFMLILLTSLILLMFVTLVASVVQEGCM